MRSSTAGKQLPWDHRFCQPTFKPLPGTIHPSVASLSNALNDVPVVVAHNPYSWHNSEALYSVLCPGTATLAHNKGNLPPSLPPSPLLNAHAPTEHHGLSSDDESGSPSDGPWTPGRNVDTARDNGEPFATTPGPRDSTPPPPSLAVGGSPHPMRFQWASVPTLPRRVEYCDAPPPQHPPSAVLPTTVVHVQYMRLPCLMPGPSVRFGESCCTALGHLPRVKLGGVCCELKPLMVAYIIYLSTGIVVAGVDMFTNHKGCCSVWVYEANDVLRLQEALDQRMWMLPCSLKCCLLATGTAARHALESLMHSVTASHKKLHFPTHLLTVQLYVRIPPNVRFSAQHVVATAADKGHNKLVGGGTVVVPLASNGGSSPR